MSVFYAALYRILEDILTGSEDMQKAYRMARIEEQLFTPGAGNSFVAGKSAGGVGKQPSIRYAFWCMSPSVVFAPMTAKVRSIVLTSGTLAPMDVLSSELSVPFKNRLEAMHIIDPEQVWVGAVSKGPNQAQLLGVYKNMETLEYQDGLGQAILEVARVVPFGVLCFLPSYGFMNKLLRRMKLTGMEDQLARLKHIFIGTHAIIKNHLYFTSFVFFQIYGHLFLILFF